MTTHTSRPPIRPHETRQPPAPDDLVAQAIVKLHQVAAEMFYLRTRLDKINPDAVVDVIPAAQAGRTVAAMAGEVQTLLDALERQARALAG